MGKVGKCQNCGRKMELFSVGTEYFDERGVRKRKYHWYCRKCLPANDPRRYSMGLARYAK